MSNTLDVPKRQGSPTTIRSSGCEAPSYQNWPLYDQPNAHFVSPSDHYFKQGRFQPYDAPFDFDEHEYMDEKSQHYEHFPAELPEKPPRPFFRAIPFIPGYEIPIRPQFTRARRHIKNPIPLSWRTGFQRLYESWVDNWWLWELLSWVVSAVCMGVIALILLLFENRSVPSSDLTLNSIISVLSGVAKAALLLPTAECLGQMKWSWFWRDTKKVEDFETFDQASRGPWGSLMLLLRTKGRTIAAFGAVITIVSVAVDPFFQQLVVFPQRWINTSINGTMPRVLNYTSYDALMYSDGVKLTTPDSTMRAFVESNIFGQDMGADIPWNCPTNNCTWNAYDTLSVCSACTDISDLLAYDCKETPLDWLSNTTQPWNLTDIPTSNVCGWWINATSDAPLLASGFIPTTDPREPGLEVLTGRLFPLFDLSPMYLNVNFTSWYGGSINYRDVQNPIIDFLAFSTLGGVPGVYANETPSAQECVVSWCVERMSPTVFNGNLTHNSGSYPMQPKGPAPFPWTMDDNYMLSYVADFDYTPPDSNERFYVSNNTIYQTIALMGDFFPLTITVSSSDSDNVRYRYPALNPHAAWVKVLPSNAWATDIAQKVKGFAKIISDVIVTSSQSVNNVDGTAATSEVFVSVRWAWFSLPFALLLLSLIFLLTTIFKCAEEEEDIGIWKTSALPVLMNGLRGDVRRQMGSSTRMGDVRLHARQTEMKLHYGKKGYRLSGMPGSVWTSSPEQKSRTWI